MRIPNNASLGEILRDARVEDGRSLREVAKHLKISPSYLSDIENDRRVPAEAILRGLAVALSLEFDQLMALAGRLENQTQRLLKRAPAAAVLFRKLSNLESPDHATARLLEEFERFSQTKTKKRK